MRHLKALALAAVVAALVPTPGRAAGVPALRHVFVIVEENTNYSAIMGNTAQAPYLNSLAAAHVQHDNYYAISHVSLGNYIGMVSGQIPHPLDHVDCFTYQLCRRDGPTIAKQVDDAGLSWKGYFSSMERPCQYPDGLIDTYQQGYATRHNPFVYFNEIVNDAAYCAAHDVPYAPNFAADLASPDGPPNYSFIVPNTCEDGHDPGCDGTKSTIQILDEWLAENVPPIVDYVSTHADSALFITFDEASNSDTSGCCNQLPLIQGGGHIGFVMVAPGVEKPHYRATAAANHYSFLRTVQEGLGLPPLAESGSPLISPMTELFTGP
jgi:hypothetical protein